MDTTYNFNLFTSSDNTPTLITVHNMQHDVQFRYSRYDIYLLYTIVVEREVIF